jgi:hypothetical protein
METLKSTKNQCNKSWLFEKMDKPLVKLTKNKEGEDPK